MSRKRTWTPVAGEKGELKAGSEDAIFRALALRTLELPVKEMLSQGLERDLPDDPGVIPALQSNMQDEDKHDLALSFVVDAHGTNPKYEREAQNIRKAWLSDPSHPILKTAILERSVFFVLLPMFRFNGDMFLRSISADISRDEQTHVLLHAMCAKDLGEVSTPALNRLRKATVSWVMDGLSTNTEDKYLDKDFWLKQSDSLYASGKAAGLAETQRARMPSFFETSNINLPKYG
jgi:hypothetical protein